MNNKVQVIYRLEDLVVLIWPVRPNISETMEPESYNVYWNTSETSPPAYILVDSVENKSHSSRSYLNKVVFNLIPSTIGDWNNSNVNWISLRPVVGGVEQAFEAAVPIHPYSINGMRISKVSTEKTVAVGYNSDNDQLIPVAVDEDGKLKTI